MAERLTAFQEVQGRIKALQSQIEHAQDELRQVFEREQQLRDTIEHLRLLKDEWSDLSSVYFVNAISTKGIRTTTDQISGPAPQPTYPVGEAGR